MKLGRNRKKSMRKVSLENREILFGSIKKGAFELGGAFGGNCPDREPSPHQVSDRDLSPKRNKDTKLQRYDHC